MDDMSFKMVINKLSESSLKVLELEIVKTEIVKKVKKKYFPCT